MSEEGELKKRFRDWAFNYDPTIESMWKEKPSVDMLEDIMKILEDAKKEFPKAWKGLYDYGRPELGESWHTPSYQDVNEWFKKWFGAVEVTNKK